MFPLWDHLPVQFVLPVGTVLARVPAVHPERSDGARLGDEHQQEHT